MLERRLRTAPGSGADFAQRRGSLVFDRYLARTVDELGTTKLPTRSLSDSERLSGAPVG